MLIFASRVQQTIPVPTDPSQTVTIQKLPRRHLVAAEKTQQTTLIGDLRQQFGANWSQEVKTFTAEAASPEQQQAARDPLLRYDVETLLRHGVKAWSYDVELNDDALGDLDREAAESIAREILRLTVPKVFDTEPGEERKNA